MSSEPVDKDQYYKESCHVRENGYPDFIDRFRVRHDDKRDQRNDKQRNKKEFSTA